MQKLRHNSSFDSSEIMYRADELMKNASNRYQITVKVAAQAKRCRYEEFDRDRDDDPMMKPVIRAVIQLSYELSEPGVIGDESIRPSHGSIISP